MVGVASFDSTVSLWDVSKVGIVSFSVKLSGQENEVKGICFSSSGEELAMCSRDKSIWIYDVSCLLDRSKGGSVDFQKVDSGQTEEEGEFVFPTSPSVVHRPSIKGEDCECLAVLQGHSQDVKSIQFNPHDLHMLVSVSYDDSIKIWRSTCADDWELSETLRGHSGTVWDVAFNPQNPNEFATVSADGSLKIWSNKIPTCPIPTSSSYLLTGPVGLSTRHHQRTNAFSPVTESWSCQTIQITSSCVENIPPAPIYSIDWSPEGLIAVACGDNTVRVILHKPSCNIPISTFKTDSEPNSVSFNPAGGRELAAGFDDGSISIFNIANVE
jgi:WD40 repeat protein